MMHLSSALWHLMERRISLIIEQIKLNNFGKFDNEIFFFPNMFSLVYGKNEDGKSTILDAIYLLFYGFKGQKTKDVRENIRKRYEPKNRSDWSGEAKFRHGDRSYILRRVFGKTNARDIVTVVDDLTGKKIDIPKSQTPGEYFFEMSEQTFFKTVYIRYSGAEISLSGKSGDELSNKLVNIATSGDEDISYREALKTFTYEKRKLINGNNNGGLLYFARRNYEDLLIERQIISSGENEKKEALKRIEELSKKLSEEESTRKEIIKKQDEYYRKAEELRHSDSYDELSEANYKLKDFLRFIFVLLICGGLSIYTYLEHKIFLAAGFVVLGIVLSVYEIYSAIKNKNNESNSVKNDDINENLIQELESIFDAEKESFEKIAKLNAEITETKTYIKTKFGGKKTVASLDIELGMKKKEIENYERDYIAICIAEDALKKAYGRMETKFKPKLNKRTEDIFYELTGKKIRIRMDEFLNVSVEDDNGTILNYDALSTGTVEQVYFALRLAITEFVSEKNLPILSDDAFIFFDEDRAESAIKFLIDYADKKNKQILFFTCQQRFLSWVEKYEKTSILELSHN